jgi:hypothetical protein
MALRVPSRESFVVVERRRSPRVPCEDAVELRRLRKEKDNTCRLLSPPARKEC